LYFDYLFIIAVIIMLIPNYMDQHIYKVNKYKGLINMYIIS